VEVLTISEKIYYLKNDNFYDIASSISKTIDPTDEKLLSSHYSIIIDDSYLFYMSMPKVIASNKKLIAIVNNYIASKLPLEDIAFLSFILLGDKILIYIVSQKLMELLKLYPKILSQATKISTPFIELISKYSDFVYYDGSKFYDVKENNVTNTVNTESEYIDAAQLISEVDIIRTSIKLPSIYKKSKIMNFPMLLPLATLIVIYIFFILGNIFSLLGAYSLEQKYAAMLNDIYESVGVANNPDPHGLLLFKVNKNKSSFDGERLLTILSDISKNTPSDIKLESFSYRDKAIRVNGHAPDFTILEKFEMTMETLLNQDIVIADSKKDQEGVSFSIRYQK